MTKDELMKALDIDKKLAIYGTEFLKLANKRAPLDTSSLIKQSRYEVDGTTVKIIYTSPYAHYLLEGYLYVDSKTGSSWARRGTKKVKRSKKLTYRNGRMSKWIQKTVTVDGKKLLKIFKV